MTTNHDQREQVGAAPSGAAFFLGPFSAYSGGKGREGLIQTPVGMIFSQEKGAKTGGYN